MSKEPIITIDFVEWSGSPSGGMTNDNRYHATRKLRCAFDDRITLQQELKGGFIDTDDDELVLPAQFPWFSAARVVSTSDTPYGDTIGADALSRGTTYEYSIVTVKYAVTQANFSSGSTDRKITRHSIDIGAEVLSVTQDAAAAPLFWDDGQANRVDSQSTPLRVVPHMTWDLTIFDVSSLPATLLSLAGKVNAAAITAAYRPDSNFPMITETVRYDGASAERTISTDGENRWNVTLHFAARDLTISGTQVTWNHAWRPGQDTPSLIYDNAGDQYLIYQTGDINAMLLSLLG